MARAGFRQNVKVSLDGSTFVLVAGVRSARRSFNNKSTDTTSHTTDATGDVVDDSIEDTIDLGMNIEVHLDPTDPGQTILITARENPQQRIYVQHMPVVGTGLPAFQNRLRVESGDEDFPQHGAQIVTFVLKPTGQKWAPIVQ